MNKSHHFQRIKKAFVLPFLILAIQFVSNAQNQDVVIIDAYKPTISDAFKINDNPKITDSVIEKSNLTYSVNPILYPTSFAVDPIKPAKMIGQPLTKLYKSYVKAGFGTKWTPFAELYFNNLRSTSQSIGVYFNHYSSSGKIKDYAFPGFSDNEADVYGRKFYRSHMLSCDIDFNRNVIHYYGYDPDQFPGISKDSIKQRFSKIGGQLKFNSTYIDSSKLNHSFSINYFNLSDKYDAMENYFCFNGSVDKNFDLFGDLFEKQKIGFIANVDHYNDINKIDTSNAAAIKLEPYFSAAYAILKFNVGLNTLIEASDQSKAHFFPDVNFNLNIYNNIFVLYGGITNDLKRNNLIDLSIENPFINTSLPLEFSYTNSKVFAGIKGCLSSYLSFNASISKSNVKGLPLFVNDTASALLNRFTVVYDKVGIFTTHTEITYQKAEKFKLLLSSNFYQYTTTNELSAWHKPNMDVKLSMNYNLKNKIILKADIIAFSGCDARQIIKGSTPAVNDIHLKGTADFNLGLEYRYTKILSAFINFNNIGAERYKQWYHYPTYGFTVLGGISYSF